MTGPAVLLRIRRVRRIGRGHGEEAFVSTVFCPGRVTTLEVATCLECPRLLHEAGDTIECTPHCDHEVRALPVTARLGGDASVGDAAGDALVCEGGVAAEVVVRALRQENGWLAVVLDDAGRSAGLVHMADAWVAPPTSHASRIARPILPVRDYAPLAHAVDRMVRERARALPVTDEHERVVALLTDLDALAWVARRRAAMATPDGDASEHGC
jgi:hypothetical protein